MDRYCTKCGLTEESEEPTILEEHHIIPKFIGGTDKNGRILLCHSCHTQLQRLLGERCAEITEEWLYEHT